MEDRRFSIKDLLAAAKEKEPTKRLWLILLISLPSIVAILAFFIVSNNYYLSPEKKYEITVYDSNYNVIASDSRYPERAPDDSAVALFFDITSDLSRTSTLPAFIDQNNYIKADVKYMNAVGEYFVYVSVEDRIGYLSYAGNTYLISDQNTEKLLSSKYSQSFYSSAVPATLCGNSETQILPKKAFWSYRTIDGSYLETNDCITSDEKILVYMSGEIDLAFDIEPDLFKIVISKDGTELFSGDYFEISKFSVEEVNDFTVKATAAWLEKEGGRFVGSMEYEFDVYVGEKPEFSVSGEEFSVDSICVIKCTNVSDITKIKIRSIPLLPSVPSFIMSGHDAIVLIPIVRNIESDVYELRVSYGTSYDVFELKVLPKRAPITVSSFISQEQLDLGLSDACTQEFDTLREFAAEASKGDKLYSGKFLDYAEQGAELYCQYGDIYATGYQKYTSKGSEYRFATNNAKVGAMNSGRVIKTGYSDNLGNYVMISHGCGLVTWYAHLDSIEVREGDHVIKGETVGRAGKTGLSSVENLFVLVTLDSNLIDPSTICGRSFE